MSTAHILNFIFTFLIFVITGPSFIILFLVMTTPILNLLLKLSFLSDFKNHTILKPFLNFYGFFYSPEMFYSTLACIINIFITFISLGMLGALLFILITPGLNLIFSEQIPLNLTGIDYAFKKSGLHGDNSWPTIIMVSILFSIGFLIAGFGLKILRSYNFNFIINSVTYLFILWLWALVLWSMHCSKWFLLKPIS